LGKWRTKRHFQNLPRNFCRIGSIVRASHLIAAWIALVLVGTGLGAGTLYADRVENQYVHAYAWAFFHQKRQGLALQRAAFRQSDLLPMYGSSELPIPDPFRAGRIFRLYPTGFNVFAVGGNGDEPILQLQMLAGIGPQLRNKRIVISLSPQLFLESRMPENAYAGNFSALHAYAFVVSDLPAGLKQRVARRMLFYTETLKDPLLNLAVQQLASTKPYAPVLTALIWPLARLQEGVLELQDHWATLQMIRNHPEVPPTVTYKPSALNWNMLAEHAATYAQAHADNNPFGINNQDWKGEWRNAVAQQHHDMTDAEFTTKLEWTDGWNDLELLLWTLKAFGAKPLLVSMPLAGAYWDYRGVSADARRVLYDKLTEAANLQQVPLVIFREGEQDKFFLRDPGSHLSAKGWVSYSRVLDAFYHDRLDALAKQ
jgi:D-alanine transfer protein